jgi:flagellar biosynthesis regulator FlaF
MIYPRLERPSLITVLAKWSDACRRLAQGVSSTQFSAKIRAQFTEDLNTSNRVGDELRQNITDEVIHVGIDVDS